jgi:siroheme synthase
MSGLFVAAAAAVDGVIEMPILVAADTEVVAVVGGSVVKFDGFVEEVGTMAAEVVEFVVVVVVVVVGVVAAAAVAAAAVEHHHRHHHLICLPNTNFSASPSAQLDLTTAGLFQQGEEEEQEELLLLAGLLEQQVTG